MRKETWSGRPKKSEGWGGTVIEGYMLGDGGSAGISNESLVEGFGGV